MRTKFITAGLFVSLVLCTGVFAKEGATGIVGQRMNGMSDMGRALKVVTMELRKGTRADMNLTELNLELLARDAELIDLLFAAEEYGQGSYPADLARAGRFLQRGKTFEHTHR